MQNNHPELQEIAKKTPGMTFSKNNLWLMGAIMRWMPTPKPPQDILIENILIAGQNDRKKLRLRIYQPRAVASPTAALLWFHGGGYVMGSPEQDDGCCTQFVRELGITVVSVDYRTAPKYPFPAALEDSFAALTWTADHFEQPGIHAQQIAIGGASAGGGLAASLAQLAYDRQAIQPVFQLLVYPMLDDRTVLRADLDDRKNVTWNQKSNRFGWESYLGQKCGQDRVPAYSVPARRMNLAGLPPAWIGVGTADIFHDEDVAYARRLKEHGVDCDLVTIPDGFHGFDVIAPHLPVTQEFRQLQSSALKRALPQ
jgi:acetyl esterase/lipase